MAELSRVIAPGNETIGVMGSHQTNFHDAHFEKIARDISFAALYKIVARPSGSEFRQRTDFVGQTSFRPRAINGVCYNCGWKGHLHYYCIDKPDPRVPRQNNSCQGGNFYGQRKSGKLDDAPVALAHRPVMGANLNEKIRSQISPADASLVDKEAFDVTCCAD